MSVHNDSGWLRESVGSILGQTLEDFEFIIIDDASTDETPRLLKEYQEKDDRIRIVTNRWNLGLAASLNRGLRAARGKYIARHDADDISLPKRLLIQREFLDTHPEMFLVGTNAIVIGENGEEKSFLNLPADERELKQALRNQNLLIHPSIMFRNDGEHFYREKFRYAQDYDFYLRLLSDGKQLINLPRALIKYQMERISPLSRKAAQQKLFSNAAKGFYRQRLRNGEDEYERFDPSPILNLDVETTSDPAVLSFFIVSSFRNNLLKQTRAYIGRYWKHHGRLNRHWALWGASFLGAGVLDSLRSLKGRLTRDRPVIGIDEAKREIDSKPRLALVFSTGVGLKDWADIGSLTREVALYKKLVERGWEVSFYTYDRSRAVPDIGFDAKVYPQWPYLFPRGLNFLYLLFFPFLHYWHGRRTSVIVTNQAHSAWPAIMGAKIWGAKVVARCGYLFGEYAETNNLAGRRARMQILGEKWTFKHADYAIIPTQELADWAVRNLGLNENGIAVIPNFVDVNLFRPSEESQRDIDVLCVGRLAEVKRYVLILEALQCLDVRLVIIGNGSMKEEIERFVKKERMDVEIVTRVKHERLPEYLNRAKIYLITSRREGHPKSLIEAMACGCACVGTDSPGINNQIVDGETGLLADSTAESIAQAVERLLKDEDLRRSLGERARRFAKSDYSLEKVYGEYERILSAVTGTVMMNDLEKGSAADE